MFLSLYQLQISLFHSKYKKFVHRVKQRYTAYTYRESFANLAFQLGQDDLTEQKPQDVAVSGHPVSEQRPHKNSWWRFVLLLHWSLIISESIQLSWSHIKYVCFIDKPKVLNTLYAIFFAKSNEWVGWIETTYLRLHAAFNLLKKYPRFIGLKMSVHWMWIF